MDKKRRQEIREEEAYRAKLRGDRKRTNTGRGCLIFILVVLGIFTLMFNPNVLNPGGNESGTSTNDDQEAEPAPAIELADGRRVTESQAAVLCQDQIKDRLKSPSTAKFPGPFSDGYERPSLRENSWIYRPSVDSENSFGAELRSRWECVFDGDKGTFSITQLE